MQAHEDIALLGNIANGDQLAFENLLGRHLNPIHGYLQRLGCSNGEAEDLAQETFLRVWQRATSFDANKAQPSTWLYRIAHNAFVDYRRKYADSVSPESMPSDSTSTDAHSINLVDMVDSEQALQQVEKAMTQLPLNQRSAVALCYLQGVSQQQAAQVLDVNLRALESLLARARRSLRKHLLSSTKKTPVA